MKDCKAWSFKFFQKIYKYSDDSEHLFIGICEKDYRETKNPVHVWKAIAIMGELENITYPKWIRDYLLVSASEIGNCDSSPEGKDNVFAALGFSSLKQLRKEDYSMKESLAFDEMCYLVSCGKTIEKAAMEVELWINKGDLKPRQRGYLGYSKLEKIYRKKIKTANPRSIASSITMREMSQSAYEEEVEKGYKKDFRTYCEDFSDHLEAVREGYEKDFRTYWKEFSDYEEAVRLGYKEDFKTYCEEFID